MEREKGFSRRDHRAHQRAQAKAERKALRFTKEKRRQDVLTNRKLKREKEHTERSLDVRLKARKKLARYAWFVAAFFLLTPFDDPGPFMEILSTGIAVLITPWRKK